MMLASALLLRPLPPPAEVGVETTTAAALLRQAPEQEPEATEHTPKLHEGEVTTGELHGDDWEVATEYVLAEVHDVARATPALVAAG